MNENPFENKPLPPSNPNINNEQLKATIEIAKLEDWEKVKELRLLSITGKDAKMFNATPESIKREQERTEKEWKKFLSNKSEFFILSQIGSETVGMIRAWKKKNGEDWHLGWAYIKEEFRGKNIGKELYEMPLDEIKKRNVKTVTAFIYKDNQKSIHLAESVGFKKVTDEAQAISLLGRENIEEWVAMEIDLTKI